VSVAYPRFGALLSFRQRQIHRSEQSACPRIVRTITVDSTTKIMVSRTSAFRDRAPWGAGVDLRGDEVRHVQARDNAFPAALHPITNRLFQVLYGFRLLWLSRGYDAVMVGDNGIWFPILLRLLRIKKRVVMTGIDWPGAGSGLLNRWAANASSAVCLNTNAEIERYSSAFRIPMDKFRLVQMAFQSDDAGMFPPTDEGYIFAGGNTDRDWDTFLRAVEGLPYPVKIFSSKVKVTSALPNVTVASVSRADYYRAMAGASCVVVPVTKDALSVRGTTTWINAMGMGKVVIVTEPHGAPDYMQQDISGFYVSHGDVDALRATINRVMLDGELRRRVATSARERAWKEFSPAAFRQKVLSILKSQ
jgi:glycosyltransferase involved in cell wall biosynthesis